MLDALRRFVNGDFFHSLILGLIVLNAGAMGFEATPAFGSTYEDLLYWIAIVSQTIFVFEIAARLIVHYPHIGKFFADSWNRFDFIVVAVSLLPAVGGFTSAARALRVLRILRLVSVSETIRGSFLQEAGGWRAATMAIALGLTLWYVFALLGFHLFGEQSPEEWGSLLRSLGTLAGAITPRGLAALWPHEGWRLASAVFLALFVLVTLSVAFNLVRALGSRATPPAEGAR